MKSLCVVVADECRARIFIANTRHGEWREQQDLVDPDARLQPQELVVDRRGHAAKAGRQGHVLGDAHLVRDKCAQRFAQRIAATLLSGAEKGEFGELLLVAPPRFLGLLREMLSPRLERLVVHSLDRELTALPIAQIRNHLPERFQSVQQLGD